MQVTKEELLTKAAEYFDRVERTGISLSVTSEGGEVFELRPIRSMPRRTGQEVQALYAHGTDGSGAEISEDELLAPVPDTWNVLREDDSNH